MSAKQKQKPGPRGYDTVADHADDLPKTGSTLVIIQLVLAWTAVLTPLGWGIFKTLQKAAILLHAG